MLPFLNLLNYAVLELSQHSIFQVRIPGPDACSKIIMHVIQKYVSREHFIRMYLFRKNNHNQDKIVNIG